MRKSSRVLFALAIGLAISINGGVAASQDGNIVVDRTREEKAKVEREKAKAEARAIERKRAIEGKDFVDKMIFLPKGTKDGLKSWIDDYKTAAIAEIDSSSTIPTMPAIHVLDVDYGANCNSGAAGATAKARSTNLVTALCEGRRTCSVAIDVKALSDPCFGVEKEFSIKYQCPGGAVTISTAAAEAHGKTLAISCP